MSIYKSSVNNPITTFMIFAAVIVIGMYSLSKMPIDLYPEMEPPYISVITTYPGANASDIETNITKRLEDALNSVDKLKEISSTSSDNLSMITLEFEWGSNLDEATNEIRDVIDRVYRYLPEDIDRPSIFKFNMSIMPVVFFAVTAKESYPGIEKILDEKIVNPLNRVDGVGSVALMGAPKRVVYVEVDPKRLDAYNLSIEQIGAVISAENLNLPSGDIKMGLMDYQLRVQGEFAESEELNKLVVGNYNGTPIYLHDVAFINDTIKDRTLDEKINGKTGLRFFVIKQSGANTVKVARKVMEEMEVLKKELPPDVEVNLIINTSDFISASVKNLSKTLLYALFFVIIVVLFFLGRWRATFIIVLTIPISLIVAFIYLFITDNSINVISLTSLSIAIGMVVDDAIVVLENITKHIERGSSPREAAIYATNEVWLSVIITTLVIVAVFFPLTLVGGMTGVIFKQLGWIVTITVVTSTLAAITLTPMLSSKMLRLRKKRKDDKPTLYARTIEVFLDRMDTFYANSLKWVLNHKKLTMISTLVLFIASLFLLKFVGTDFMPQTDDSRITVNIELQTGTRVEETSKIARKLEKIIKDDFPEVQTLSSSSGADDEGNMFSFMQSTGSNVLNMMMRLKQPNDRKRNIWEISDALRQEIAKFPEVILFSVNTGNSGGFGGSTNTVDVEIYGYDFNSTNAIAEEIRSKVSKIKGTVDVHVSRPKDKPELQVILDKDKIAQHGLNSAIVSTQISNRISGLTPSLYREAGDEYDIRVRLAEDFRNSISDIEDLTIVTQFGQRIKLKEIGQVKEYWGPPSIRHKKKERIVTVSVKPENIPLGELAEKVMDEVKKVEKPQEVLISVGGAYKDQQESFMDLGLLLLVSLLLVFIAMASQFESFSMPFVIMFSIPFAFTGVILALLITGTTLSLIAALGAVLLIGIVVKNGIVLVDYTNLMRDRDMRLNDAIIAAGKSRLRPVLMTALTTILGMLPLALSTGEGSEIWRPMGISVIGGLIFSTLVTMVLIPVMYALVARHGERDKISRLRSKFQDLD